MSLAFALERTVDEHECANCPTTYRVVHGQLTWFGEPHAVFFAGCHNHDGTPDVLIDVILGWAKEEDPVTFGCRVGPVEGAEGPVATLVAAAQSYGDDPEWGRKLSRAEALDDPRLQVFWDAVDYILIQDPTVRPHVYGTA